MTQQFTYSNKKNPIQWIGLLFCLIAFSFLSFLYGWILIKKNENSWELLIPIIGLLIIILSISNRLFWTKIIITEKYIEYKSIFRTVKIEKEQIKGYDIVKKPKRSAPVFLPITDIPDFNFGKHFIIIRRSFIRPDGSLWLLTEPTTDSYITMEYRTDIYNAVKRLIV